jgi:hypothetical protein
MVELGAVCHRQTAILGLKDQDINKGTRRNLGR